MTDEILLPRTIHMIAKDNSAVLEEKIYEINGKRYILRPMTLAKEVAYLAAIDHSKDTFSGAVDSDNALSMMEKIADRVPEILAIVLDIEPSRSPLMLEDFKAEIAAFPPAKLEEIVNDFFAFNPSWAVGEVSQRVTAILGIVMGRPQKAGETPSSTS